MATTEVLPPITELNPTLTGIKPTLEIAVPGTPSRVSKVTFNPQEHINFKPPSKTYSMSDIKLENSPISSFAVSEPFPLFTPEAIQHMRAEIFKPEVMDNFRFSSNLAHCQLRGYAAK